MIEPPLTLSPRNCHFTLPSPPTSPEPINHLLFEAISLRLPSCPTPIHRRFPLFRFRRLDVFLDVLVDALRDADLRGALGFVILGACPGPESPKLVHATLIWSLIGPLLSLSSIRNSKVTSFPAC